MNKSSRTKKEDKWLKALGKHIDELIKKQGYQSPYDFWIQKAGDDISRATLNYIINGEVDTKATTLKKIAQLLGLTPKDLFNF